MHSRLSYCTNGDFWSMPNRLHEARSHTDECNAIDGNQGTLPEIAHKHKSDAPQSITKECQAIPESAQKMK
eukprot:3111232-Amphidinium_carterae.1